MKYHDESTKVSIVSVSRRAGPQQEGQVGVDPLVHGGERRLALGGVVGDVGELDRQLVVGDGDDSALRRSGRRGSGSPSSAGARGASRAGGS